MDLSEYQYRERPILGLEGWTRCLMHKFCYASPPQWGIRYVRYIDRTLTWLEKVLKHADVWKFYRFILHIVKTNYHGKYFCTLNFFNSNTVTDRFNFLIYFICKPINIKFRKIRMLFQAKNNYS